MQDTPKSTVMLSARSSIDPFGPGEGAGSEEDEHLNGLLASASDHLVDRRAHSVLRCLAACKLRRVVHLPRGCTATVAIITF